MDNKGALGEKPQNEDETHRDADGEEPPEPRRESSAGKDSESDQDGRKEGRQADDRVWKAEQLGLCGEHHRLARDERVDVARQGGVRIGRHVNAFQNEAE